MKCMHWAIALSFTLFSAAWGQESQKAGGKASCTASATQVQKTCPSMCGMAKPVGGDFKSNRASVGCDKVATKAKDVPGGYLPSLYSIGKVYLLAGASAMRSLDVGSAGLVRDLALVKAGQGAKGNATCGGGCDKTACDCGGKGCHCGGKACGDGQCECSGCGKGCGDGKCSCADCKGCGEGKCGCERGKKACGKDKAAAGWRKMGCVVGKAPETGGRERSAAKS